MARMIPYAVGPEPEPKIKMKEICLRNDARLEELLDAWWKDEQALRELREEKEIKVDKVVEGE